MSGWLPPGQAETRKFPVVGERQPLPEALDLAASGLKAAGSELGALVGPNASLEEMYLAQKLVRGLGGIARARRILEQSAPETDSAPA